MFECIKRTIASLILLVIATGYSDSLQLQGEYPKGRDKAIFVVAKAVMPQTYVNNTNRPSAEEILASYERSLVVMRKKVSFTAELDQILNGAFSFKAKKYKHTRIVYRDETRFGLSRESKRFDDQNKMIGHDWLTSIYDGEKEMITQNSYGQPTEDLLVDFRPQSFMDCFLANLGKGRLLDGVTYGAHNKTFFEVMSEARSLQLRDQMEVVDGHKTYVLEADTKYGKHILWIDPEFGFSARRMAIHKVLGDYDFDTKLGDQPRPLPPNTSPWIPWCATVKSGLTVDDIHIEMLNGRYVPISAKIREYKEFEDSQFTEVISDYKRRDIDFNPDFDAMVRNFLEEIPDETTVYVYYEQSSTATYKWQNGEVVDFQGHKVDYKPKKPQSLLGKPLPNLEGFGVSLSAVRDRNNIFVICFWDMNQRPSRNCIQQLSKRAPELKAKDVSIVAVQTSKVEQDALNEWIKGQNISFPVGMVSNDKQAIRFTWGVKSLPWLILTDRQHIVRAEGFGISELSLRLEEAGRPNAKEEIERRRRTSAESEIERLGGSIVKACENDVNYTEVSLLGLRYRRQWTGGDWGASYLNDLANLRKLRIQDVEAFTDEGMKHLKGLQSLEFLMLVRTGVSDGGLIHLKDLTNFEFLGLMSNKFTDAGLENIMGMTKLKSLRLDDARITDGGLRRLKQCGLLTRLEFLALSRTQITDAGLAYLQGMDRLRRLYLGGTRIGDEGISHLAKLSKLEVLTLSNTNITDAGLAHLRGLRNLNMLYLQNTQLTDAGLEHLKESVNLVELWLGGTKITDAGFAHIQGLTSLQSISLERTAVTDKGLTYLKPLTALRELFLKQSNITIDGYMDLKEVLPDCQIYWEEKKNNDSA